MPTEAGEYIVGAYLGTVSKPVSRLDFVTTRRSDETPRAHGRAMGTDRAFDSGQCRQDRAAIQGPPPDARRYLLGAGHRRPLACPARTLRPVPDRPPVLHAL